MEDIKKLLATEQVLIGTDRVIKAFQENKLQRVFVAKNCKDSVRSDIEKYASVSGVEVVSLDVTNDEFGVLCKKPFAVSVLGVLKK